MTRDERFDRGIGHFNGEKFFEAHEVWEDLWHEYREPDRKFLQGLIQLAAGFYHAQCDNVKGAQSQLRKGSEKLELYRPRHHTIEVDALLGSVAVWLSALGRPSGLPVELHRYPRIEHRKLSPSS